MKEFTERQNIGFNALVTNRTPVLLQQGFLPILSNSGGVILATEEYRARTDRGYLKYFDVIPGTNDTPELNQDVRFTLGAGGQVLVENEMLGMWSPLSQFGKDKKWRIRSIVNNAQTIQFSLDSANASLEQQAILIASYSTKYHEAFLKQFKLKWGLGLKRKSFVLKIPAGTPVGNISIDDILPRNNGLIIGVGISNAYDIIGTQELTTQFMNLAIDGVNIIEDVPALYYNYLVGRETFLQPILLRPGATFNFNSNLLSPALNDIFHTVTFYFDN